MKKFKVTIVYTLEGYNGYDHSEHRVFEVLARNTDSAIKKASKQVRKDASVTNAFVEGV